ncbi:MAG: ABC transporter ATP-binding protein [Clostridia bacterium]|nr:ABC transporter ATP-binding protein [Clostridia bacterium]
MEKNPLKVKKEHTKAAMSRFWGFTKGYRLLTLFCPLLIFLDVIVELEIPDAMGNVVDILNQLNNTSYDSSLIWGELTQKLIEMLLLCIATLIIGYLASRCSAIASMGFGANLRRELFNKTQDLSFENIDRLKISSLITRMTTDVSQVQNVYKNTIVQFIKGPFMLITALIKALSISKELSVVFSLALPAIIIVLAIMGYLAVPIFKKMLKTTDEFNGTLRGNINGIRVVKSFVREEHEKSKFDKVNTAVMEMNVRAQKLALYVTPAIMLIIYGCMIFSMWRGSYLIIENKTGLTLGEMTTFVNYITQVLSSLMTVLLVFVSMILAKASIGRIGEVFAEEPTVSDKGNNPELKLKNGDIEFRNVSFKYSKDAVKNILDDVNLKINSGETVGIIGSTGSSKSTLIQLIPRLYDPTEGEVLVGGNNVRDYTFENLRSEVSVVLQQNILFSGTIMENIRWGKPDATQEEIIEAAKDAQAHEFISGFEKGYETELGQGGNTVSGGQKQRICIARALLKKPKIIILDDSTSAVDTATDTKIRMALRSEKYSGITKIIIAQRITSIMDADRIIVIDNGKIDSVGTHEQLTKSSEIYHEIFVSQQEGVLAQ